MAVALYARVSTSRQVKADLSIPDQLEQMRAWCKEQGLTVAREYVEGGLTATDDNRPEFRRMMDDATMKPAPYEAIIVHSRSRFFRDAISCGLYERQLKKLGARLISITQLTADDSNGRLMNLIISAFDGHFSEENAKHTSRTMKANARRGFFNGSRAPFGYKAVDTDVMGSRGKVRKKLEIDEGEAFVVHKIYDLYLNSLDGKPMGMKAICQHLNGQGLLMRCRPWQIQKMQEVLSSDTYRGEYCFNIRDSRAGQIRPESEWIRSAVPAIVSQVTWDAVRRKRESMDPHQYTQGKEAPRNATSPVLLAGLIKCEACGGAMTTATGKGGRYRYYKCSHKISTSPSVCATPNLPMERIDQLVLQQMVERVLTPERVTQMLREHMKHRQSTETEDQERLKQLSRALATKDDGLNNLYRAIEQGIVSLDSTLQVRVNALKDEREALLVEIAGIKHEQPSPRKVSPKQVAYALERMKAMLLDPYLGYGKQLLRYLVTDIRVEVGQMTLRGSVPRLEKVVAEMKMGTAVTVPTFISTWCPRHESNV